MKRRFIFSALLAGVLMLSACNKVGGTSSLGDIAISDDSLVNSELIDANYEYEEEELDPLANPANYKNASFMGSQVEMDYSSYGLLVVKNDYDNIGFYSLLHGQYIFECQFVPDWLSYSVSNVSGVGFVLSVLYENSLSIVDGFGNLLYSTSGIYQLPYLYSLERHIINDKYYLSFTIDYLSFIYSYDNDGKATKINSLPSEQQQVDVDEYDGPEKGDLYTVGWLDLKEYGLNDYSVYIEDTGRVSVFHEQVYITSFVIPFATSTYGIVGDCVVYQESYVLPDDALTYDYFDGSNKYALLTHVVNIKTGQTSEKNLAMLIESFMPIKDTEKL